MRWTKDSIRKIISHLWSYNLEHRSQYGVVLVDSFYVVASASVGLQRLCRSLVLVSQLAEAINLPFNYNSHSCSIYYFLILCILYHKRGIFLIPN